MKIWTLIGSVVLCVAACAEMIGVDRGLDTQNKVQNGTPAGDGAHGYVVSVLTDTFCTGTLIDRQTVLTTASCLSGDIGRRLVLYEDAQGNVKNSWISSVLLHPRWTRSARPSEEVNNIGLIYLESAIETEPVRLSSAPPESFLERDGIFIGYGRRELEDPTQIGEKQRAKVLVSDFRVEGLLFNTVTSANAAEAVCVGDTGGPLIIDDEQVAVSSYITLTPGGCLFESGMTAISGEHRAWIELNQAQPIYGQAGLGLLIDRRESNQSGGPSPADAGVLQTLDAGTSDMTLGVALDMEPDMELDMEPDMEPDMELDMGLGVVAVPKLDMEPEPPPPPPVDMMPPPPAPPSCVLYPGTVLEINHRYYSCNGQYFLVMQGDGHLVQYDAGNGVHFRSGTNGVGAYAVFQGDGNLVIYNSSNVAVWHTVTHGLGARNLNIQDDGNIVIYNGATVLWDAWTYREQQGY